MQRVSLNGLRPPDTRRTLADLFSLWFVQSPAYCVPLLSSHFSLLTSLSSPAPWRPIVNRYRWSGEGSDSTARCDAGHGACCREEALHHLPLPMETCGADGSLQVSARGSSSDSWR